MMPYSVRPIPARIYGRLKYNLKNFIEQAVENSPLLTPEDVASLQKLCDLLVLGAQSPIDFDDDGTRISPALGTLTECDVQGHLTNGGYCCERCGAPL